MWTIIIIAIITYIVWSIYSIKEFIKHKEFADVLASIWAIISVAAIVIILIRLTILYDPLSKLIELIIN